MYRISVEGRLSPSLSERLAEMRIELAEARDDECSPVTTLMGPLADQAQLAGVLSALFERRLPILSVEALSEASTVSNEIQ